MFALDKGIGAEKHLAWSIGNNGNIKGQRQRKLAFFVVAWVMEVAYCLRRVVFDEG